MYGHLLQKCEEITLLYGACCYTSTQVAYFAHIRVRFLFILSLITLTRSIEVNIRILLALFLLNTGATRAMDFFVHSSNKISHVQYPSWFILLHLHITDLWHSTFYYLYIHVCLSINSTQSNILDRILFLHAHLLL